MTRGIHINLIGNKTAVFIQFNPLALNWFSNLNNEMKTILFYVNFYNNDGIHKLYTQFKFNKCKMEEIKQRN